MADPTIWTVWTSICCRASQSRNRPQLPLSLSQSQNRSLWPIRNRREAQGVSRQGREATQGGAANSRASR